MVIIRMAGPAEVRHYAWQAAGALVIVCATVLTTTGAPGVAQSPPAAAVQRVVDHPKLRIAMDTIDRQHDRLVADIIALTEIPAPPFKEDARGAAFLKMLRAHNLTDVERDAEGNVMGVRRGTGGGPLIAVAAHLDTVFPEGTVVRVTREGTRLAAPGVGDNTRSLAVLLAIIRAMDAARIQTASDILFIGNVGEEGPGDLRGMKYLFQRGPYTDRIGMFIAMDGAGGGDDITHGAVGSRRFRVTFTGPGGHSYGAFGLVNPAFAMGNAMRKFGGIQVPSSPKTTYSVGVVGGGTSVNSIPFESWMEVDMRSESAAELQKVEAQFRAAMQQAVDEENQARSTAQGRIAVDLKLIGDRPSGQTPRDSAIVETAAAVVRAMGRTPRFSVSSTDANLPISLGIPAITIDSGGRGGRAHALDEWIDVEKTSSLEGIRSALTLLLTLAGVQ
jgi:acetylornithine deacetylase/succinyl-diaminopimelate desuccinylase-like protein